MSGYKGHIAGAITINTLYVAGARLVHANVLTHTGGLFSEWQFAVGLYIVAVLFGLWSDIDTNSKGQDIFYGLAFVTDILLIWRRNIEAAALLGLLAMTPIVGKYRGWTHSKLAMVLVPLPIVVATYAYRPAVLPTAIIIYGAAFSGYFSHLLLDGLISRHIHFKGKSYGN